MLWESPFLWQPLSIACLNAHFLVQVMVRPSFVLGGRAMEIVYRCRPRVAAGVCAAVCGERSGVSMALKVVQSVQLSSCFMHLQ